MLSMKISEPDLKMVQSKRLGRSGVRLFEQRNVESYNNFSPQVAVVDRLVLGPEQRTRRAHWIEQVARVQSYEEQMKRLRRWIKLSYRQKCDERKIMSIWRRRFNRANNLKPTMYEKIVCGRTSRTTASSVATPMLYLIQALRPCLAAKSALSGPAENTRLSVRLSELKSVSIEWQRSVVRTLYSFVSIADCFFCQALNLHGFWKVNEKLRFAFLLLLVFYN